METKYVISTGGTGGHIFPALAVAETLREKGHDVVFLLGGPKVETEIPFPTERIKSGHLHGLSLKTILGLLNLVRGTLRALLILKKTARNRDIRVIATGSYAALPVLIASNLLSIRYYLLEQNLLPGRVTRLFSRKARAVLGAFNETREYLKGTRFYRTGNPVRKMLLSRVERTRARKELSLPQDMPLVLVVGGSLGAQSLARNALWATEFLQEVYFLIQTGRRNFRELAGIKGREGANFRLVPHIDRMDLAYSSADIAVSRAGGGAIAELALYEIPSILVPLPAASRNHQYINARALKDRGAAIVLEEKDLTPESLALAIDGLLKNRALAESIRRSLRNFAASDAALKIVHIAEES